MENKTIEFNFKVGNDNGNSEHDLIINNVLIRQPNVISKVRHIPNLDEVNYKYVAEHIESNLIVSLISPSATTGNYYCGEYALKSGEKVRSVEIGIDNNKIHSEIIIINTLAQIAGQAVKQAFKQNPELNCDIKVKVDMSTALPVSQYSKANAEEFAKEFTSKNHQLTVHVASLNVNVNIEFVYVKVIPEGVTAVHSLQNSKGEIFDEFSAKYKLKNVYGEYFKNKRILHMGIGEGTTEYPITDDIAFVPNIKDGSNNGLGHAINKSLDEFRDRIGVLDYSRQKYSDVLKDENHKYNEIAFDIISDYIEEQADEILEKAKNKLQAISNEVDIIAVYGGGSILMREHLEKKLDNICKRADIKLFYVPKDYAVTLEVDGLYKFATGPIFKALKEKALTK